MRGIVGLVLSAIAPTGARWGDVTVEPRYVVREQRAGRAGVSLGIAPRIGEF